jgi:2-dehydro-3-deoxyphosphogluconate aldolase/(4S)-4-hydroxy-2-oxoglutarate aldolase
VNAVVAGGVTVVELSMTTPGALEMIADLARWRADEVIVGAGSVLGASTARQAVDAGARFVVSPVHRAEVISEAHRHGVPAMPSAYTPTEILDAYDGGGDLVKLFPAATLGPAFLEAVLAPMPFLRVIATGGITPESAGAWVRAGAAAVGLGAALVDPRLVAAGDLTGLTARARAVAAAVADARSERPLATPRGLATIQESDE